MTIVYSCVARGTVVLCSHQIGAGSFEDVARSMLPNINTRMDTKVTYTSNNYLFHTIVANGIIYMCAADKDIGHRQPYAYLMEVKQKIEAGSLANRVQFAMDGELNRDFAQVMSGQMEHFSNPGSGNDNVSALQSQVNEVKGIMTQNIEKVLERGERLEDLIQHTTELESHSATFRKTARQVHKKMWWKNTKMTICLVGTVLLVILIIILIILFSTHVLPPKSGGDSTTTTTTTVTPTP